MLLQIFHDNLRETYSPTDTIPMLVLKIKTAYDVSGVFAAMTIPKNVTFGPFADLSMVFLHSKALYQLKNGKLTSAKNSTSSNWMHHVNTAPNASIGNLTTFQQNGNLYFRSDREIAKGQQLLVWFDEKHIVDPNSNDTYYIPERELELAPVYACTFCCLGFGADIHLWRHKTVCLYNTHQGIKEGKRYRTKNTTNESNLCAF